MMGDEGIKKIDTYEAVIGLEVHAQLSTQTKMFCACSTKFGDEPNSNICPICMGHPGTLPVVNAEAVNMAIKAGFATGCFIHTKSIFARKNYFYPDLSKGYQISQYDRPICTGGSVNIEIGGKQKKIGITRIHLEEDAGKLMHDTDGNNTSLVDFNRCGIPLIEIVSEPDMRTPKEASTYLKTLRNILVYLDVCRGNLQEGNFRCDANVSVRPKGSSRLGIRTEMKNLNSYRAVERSIAYEIKRQIEEIKKGNKIIQETRLWNDAAGKTEAMRTKEMANDYRYFPEPDIPPLILDAKNIDEIKKSLPELAAEKVQRFVNQYTITTYDAKVLAEDRFIAEYFERTVELGAPSKKAANWILSELLRELNDNGDEISKCKIKPQMLSDLIGLVEDGSISGKMAKDIFSEMYKMGNTPKDIIEKRGLKQMSDGGELEGVVDGIIARCPKQVEQYKNGKTAVLGFFVGQIMKETKGSANPKLTNEILKKKLG